MACPTSKPFMKLQADNILIGLLPEVLLIDWRSLRVTSQTNKRMIEAKIFDICHNNQLVLNGFTKHYGSGLQCIANLYNLELPQVLEAQIISAIESIWPKLPSPVIRLQVIEQGTVIPIHIDKTMHASMIIPVSGHDGSLTRFYAGEIFDDNLADPASCHLIDVVEVDQPTIINTDVWHDVCLAGAEQRRISITSKWSNYAYDEIIQAID